MIHLGIPQSHTNFHIYQISHKFSSANSAQKAGIYSTICNSTDFQSVSTDKVLLKTVNSFYSTSIMNLVKLNEPVSRSKQVVTMTTHSIMLNILQAHQGAKNTMIKQFSVCSIFLYLKKATGNQRIRLENYDLNYDNSSFFYSINV